MLPFIGELLNEKILKFLREEAKYVEKTPDEDSAGADEAAEAKTENQEAGE
jgi:hypothetical protein